MAQMTKTGGGAKKGGKAEPKKDEVQEILYNRKLRHDYAVLDSWEAGMLLMGSEVKSLRAGDVQWGDAHARVDGERGEIWLYGLHIGEYRQAGTFGHKPQQPRKLLLKRREIDRVAGAVQGKGLTLIPERLLFRRGWAKIVICLAKGKTHEDKRQDLKKKAADRDVERELARRAKRER
jgi:SsrA-binding protein